jgi:O-antigen/teichoic acid export membrane protein
MVASVPPRRFGRAVLVLAGGAAGAQLVNAAVSPILTRLYSPFEMGQLGLFLAFIYVASMTLSLRYDQAVAVAETDADAARVAVLAMRLVPFTAVAATAILFALGQLRLGGFETLPVVALPLMLLGLVLFGVFTVGRFWLIRRNEYRTISEVQVVQSLGRAGGQVALGIAGLGLGGLIVGDVAARGLGLARVLRTAMPAIAAARVGSSTASRSLARRFWRFAVLGVPSSLLNAFAFSLPVPLLAGMYGVPAAGFFALVQRVLGLPLTIVGASVGDALLARMSELAREDPGAALPFFRRTALALAAIGLPIAVVGILAAPPVFATVFGEEWRVAGEMAALMAPWYLAALIVSPLSRVALVFEGQGAKLVYDTVSLAAVIAVFASGAALGLDALEAIGLLSALEVLAYGLYFVILYRLVSRRTAAPRNRTSPD